MNRRAWTWVLGILVFVVGTMWLRYRVLSNRDAAEFQAQLRLARAEGIPTNAAEFTATIRPAKPAENAAEFYRKLRPLTKSLGDYGPVGVALLRHPSPETLVAAKKYVSEATVLLDLVDQATARPRCWFDRDWSDGPAVLLPEYADMKRAANILGIRSSVAAADGDVQTALRNAAEIFNLSKHASEEGMIFSALVGDAIYSIGLRDLADLCVLHPQVRGYRDALTKALETQPTPDFRREYRDRLFLVLWGIDRAGSKAGREKLGLSGENAPPVESRLLANFLSQARAKIAIVQAERARWAALLLPPAQRKTALDQLADRENRALLAFPYLAASGVYMADGSVENELELRQLHQIEYAAVLRAVSNGTVASSIKTDDLKSPYDGKPLTYLFDGKQILISVSHGPESPTKLKIPPDEPRKVP